MIALVTGGAGFIGSHLVRALLEEGAHVRVLDDFSTGRRANLHESKAEVIEGDLRDSNCVRQAVRSTDVIFHEAAFVSVAESMEKPQLCLDINVNGYAQLLDAARQAGVRRVVLASSAAVYGDSDALPLSEDTTLRPLSPYAVSKRVDEMYGELFTEQLGLEVVALRYFNVYGPRQRPDSVYAAAIPIFVKRLLDGKPVTIFGDGGQSRDLIYVGDVVAANLLAAQHPRAAGQVFNICSGVETRLLDLLDSLYTLFPNAPQHQFAPARRGDIYRSVGSPSKAAALLGYSPQVSLADGLRATLEATRSTA